MKPKTVVQWLQKVVGEWAMECRLWTCFRIRNGNFGIVSSHSACLQKGRSRPAFCDGTGIKKKTGKKQMKKKKKEQNGE